MTVNLSLSEAQIQTILTTVAGVLAVVLPNVGLGSLNAAVQSVITAIGGLLLAITGYHAASTVAYRNKLNAQAELAAKLGITPEHLFPPPPKI